MNQSRGLSFVVLFLSISLTASMLLAAVPILISHEGRLLDGADHPLSGTYSLTYSIFDVATGGAALWTEDHPGVSVVDGLFAVELGSTVPLNPDILSGSSGVGGGAVVRYLQVQITGQPPVTPRTKLEATPYAVVSSRVSGDVESAAGSLSGNDGSHDRWRLRSSGGLTYVGTWNASNSNSTKIYADNDSAGMSVNIDDHDLLGLRVNSGINSPIPYTVLHLSDVSGKGTSSLVCAADSVTETRGVAASSGGYLIKNMRSRINDLESRLSLASDLDADGVPDLQLSGVTGQDSALLKVSSKDASQTRKEANIGAVLNGNVVIGCATFPSGTVVADNSSSMTADDTSSTFTARGSNGKYYITGATHKSTGGGASVVVAADLDGDGHDDRSVWQKVDNSEALSSTTVDSDHNGLPDVGTEVSATVTRNILKSFFLPGSKPTSSQFVVTADSSGVSSDVSIDLNHDNNPEGGCSMDAIETRSILKTYFETGDVPTQDNIVQTSCDSDGASVSLRKPMATLTWGSGLAFRVDSTGQSITMDQDSLPTFTAQSTASSTELRLAKAIADGDTKLRLSAGSADCHVQLGDINRDGFADLSTSSGSDPAIPQSASLRLGRPAVNTALFSADDQSASMTLTHAGGVGDKPTSAQFGTLIDSYIHMTEDGVVRSELTSSDGLQLRDQFNNLTSSISTEGNGYFAAKVGVGVTNPTRSIEVAGGAYCDGTNWVNASDENCKENFAPVNGEELLNQISQLEITKWNYKGDAEREHIGPTAQNFQATFGVGSDGKSISTIDPSGIALAAIKELNKQNHDLQLQSRTLAEQNRTLQDQNEKLKQRLDELAQKVEKLASGK